MEFIIFTLVQAVWFGAISWKFYVAAERKAWEAFIPVYNAYVLVKIAERPVYWVLLYCIPVVGVVMGIIMIYELLHVFKFRKTWQTAAVMASFGLYLGYLNYKESLKYWGRDDAYIKKNLGEGVNSIFFAVVVATVIRSTTFEAYTIPTSSMEKSLMVGDFLFVSKMHYGVRVPMTPISLPLVHNKVPFAGIPSYLNWPQIPYLRLPAISPIESGDPVVFNYPMDNMPVDKKENYVKRCIGTPGDSLEIVDRTVLVNGNAFRFPDRSYPQYLYYVKTDGRGFSKSGWCFLSARMERMWTMTKWNSLGTMTITTMRCRMRRRNCPRTRTKCMRSGSQRGCQTAGSQPMTMMMAGRSLTLPHSWMSTRRRRDD